MPHKLRESFTATHVTILALGAMLVPGALYAIPSYTNIAIEDIYTGNRATVDPTRRLRSGRRLQKQSGQPRRYRVRYDG